MVWLLAAVGLIKVNGNIQIILPRLNVLHSIESYEGSMEVQIEGIVPVNPFTAIADELNADILLLNASMDGGVDEQVRQQLMSRNYKRDNLVVIVVTPGGSADVAYRTSLVLQSAYSHITICVAGWCKSAGTLLAISGHELVIGPRGELGPLDVQIAKRDDLAGDRDSGLVLNEAIAKLRDESFGIFENYMIRLIANSQNAITFRTAADIASQMTIGLMAPVFDKIDPLRLGADARAMNIGQQYALRLNVKSGNLKGNEALNMLLNGYPCHSFVIEFDEAQRLFTNVKLLEGRLGDVVEGLKDVALVPSNMSVIGYVDGEKNAAADNDTEGDVPEAEGFVDVQGYSPAEVA